MKKLLIAATLFISSLALAQLNYVSLADMIKKDASENFLFTGIEIPVLKQIMGDVKKEDTVTYNLKDAGGFDSVYRVKKSETFVQIFESTMVYWVTFSLFLTADDVQIAMVTSAQKDSNGRGNDLNFYSMAKKKQISPVGAKWYADVVAFANGKCKVPKENIHFELKDGAETIKISGFDIFLTGKKYTLSGELTTNDKGVWSFNQKTAKC